jgi:hypothetical protein
MMRIVEKWASNEKACQERFIKDWHVSPKPEDDETLHSIMLDIAFQRAASWLGEGDKHAVMTRPGLSCVIAYNDGDDIIGYKDEQGYAGLGQEG